MLTALTRLQLRHLIQAAKTYGERSLVALVSAFVPYHHNPFVHTAFDHYVGIGATFTSIWKRDLPTDHQAIREALQELRMPLRKERPFTNDVLEWFDGFLRHNGETAVVILAVLYMMQTQASWRDYNNRVKDIIFRYPGHCMLEIPTLKGITPLEVLLTMENIAKDLKGRDFENCFCGDCIIDGTNNKHYAWIHPWSILKKNAEDPQFITQFLSKIYPEIFAEEFKRLQQMASQEPELTQKWPCLSHEVTQLYFFRRACDLFLYGPEIVDVTFPQSVVSEMTPAQVKGMVEFLVQYLVDHKRKSHEKRV